MNNQNRNENETREIKDKGNNSENPWKTDTRSNQVRFTQTFKKGHWAKVKFEIFGYHTEKDKNGEIKLYTFENEMVKEVLRAIIRKGRMIQDDTFAILPRWAKDNRKITREESIEHMVKETYFS